jgi:hypothetical protein
LYLSVSFGGITAELARILTTDVKHNCGAPQQLHGVALPNLAPIINALGKIKEYPLLTPR